MTHPDEAPATATRAELAEAVARAAKAHLFGPTRGMAHAAQQKTRPEEAVRAWQAAGEAEGEDEGEGEPDVLDQYLDEVVGQLTEAELAEAHLNAHEGVCTGRPCLRPAGA